MKGIILGGTSHAAASGMELHKIGGLIGNGLGWGTLALALAVGIALVMLGVTQLLRHRHA